jgi:hypothetical protein
MPVEITSRQSLPSPNIRADQGPGLLRASNPALRRELKELRWTKISGQISREEALILQE